jgi:hypothetical protein
MELLLASLKPVFVVLGRLKLLLKLDGSGSSTYGILLKTPWGNVLTITR